VATGHHARIVLHDGLRFVARGADAAKDQSYVVHMLSQADLARTLFPVGHLTKAAVRERAAAAGLRTAAKPDSQDVCFITHTGGREAFLGDRIAFRPATVVDTAGATVGRVEAVELVTVGQRRGLDIGGVPEPLYVIAIDATANRVVAGPRAALAVAEARLEGVNALGPLEGPVEVKVRSMAALAPARWEGERLVFDAPLQGVSPGQAAVAYRGSRVLGGATIAGTVGVAAEAGLMSVG